MAWDQSRAREALAEYESVARTGGLSTERRLAMALVEALGVIDGLERGLEVARAAVDAASLAQDRRILDAIGRDVP